MMLLIESKCKINTLRASVTCQWIPLSTTEKSVSKDATCIDLHLMELDNPDTYENYRRV